ncbi:uncharacterized protein [Apostichopus japonicus]|uniref:uncharacterized protein isoform X3 n=1 Tax=Stichopus japonicus TaxID=307972 RepID=UPI003AB5D7BC
MESKQDGREIIIEIFFNKIKDNTSGIGQSVPCIVKKKAAKSSENQNKKTIILFNQQKKIQRKNQKQKNKKKKKQKNHNQNQNELYNVNTLLERQLKHLKKHKRELVLKIPTMAVVDIVYEITEEQEENIQSKLDREGDCSANRQLLKSVMKYDDGYVKLVKALEKIGGLHNLVEKLSKDDEGLSLMEEVEHTEPLDRFDKHVALQHENFSSSPRAAIHREENEDTLDNYINELIKTIFKNGKSKNNISNNMSRKYGSKKTKHSKSFTKKRYNGYKKTKCLLKKRKVKNKVTLYKKVKAQNHVNKHCNKSIINTQDKKKTHKEIKVNINDIIAYSRPERRNIFAVHEINAPMPSFLCIPLNVEHNDIQDNIQINKDTQTYSHDNRGSSCTTCEKVCFVFPEINPSTPIGLYIPSNNEIKRQYDIQDNKKANKATKTNFQKTGALLGPAVGKVFSALGIIASIYCNNHNI